MRERKLSKRGSRGAAAVLAVAAAGLFGFASLGTGGDAENKADEGDEFLSALTSAARLVSFLIPEPRYTIAHPTGPRVALHTSPHGRLIARVSSRTQFGSPRTFLVAETRGDWIGVVSPRVENGRLAWLDRGSGEVDFTDTSYSIQVDLSSQTLELRDGSYLVHRAAVSIGQAGHSTPAGRFAVTDAIAGRGLGPWYGCCVLAISGHQPNLPPGWVGGNRIAIHGTPGPVGGAVSNGCLRTSNRDMVALFARAPLGAPVFIAE